MIHATAFGAGQRLTGQPFLPRRLCRLLGVWPRGPQRACPHPRHRRRVIGGDERQYGYRQQCMECGLLSRQAPEETT